MLRNHGVCPFLRQVKSHQHGTMPTVVAHRYEQVCSFLGLYLDRDSCSRHYSHSVVNLSSNFLSVLDFTYGCESLIVE